MKTKIKSHWLNYYNEKKYFDNVTREFDNKMCALEKIKFNWGCYFLYNCRKELVYVGMSSNLPARSLDSYLQKNKKEDISYISYIVTKSLSDMPFLEQYFISKHKPKFNIQNKFYDKFNYDLKINLPKKLYKVNKTNN